MKKLVTLILALALTLSLAACGSSNTPATSGSASSGSAAGSGDAAFTTAVPGVLSMATEATFPPYEYYDGDAIVGIDVEIAPAIAADGIAVEHEKAAVGPDLHLMIIHGAEGAFMAAVDIENAGIFFVSIIFCPL